MCTRPFPRFHSPTHTQTAHPLTPLPPRQSLLQFAPSKRARATMTSPSGELYGVRPGYIIPNPSVERGIACVITSHTVAPGETLLAYGAGTNVVIRQLEVGGWGGDWGGCYTYLTHRWCAPNPLPFLRTRAWRSSMGSTPRRSRWPGFRPRASISLAEVRVTG